MFSSSNDSNCVISEAISTLLSSNDLNNVMGLQFNTNTSDIWGIQYHPEITYEKMISLIEFRKDRLIQTRKVFRDEEEIKNHILFIKKEIAVSNKSQRMIELKNWMDSINWFKNAKLYFTFYCSNFNCRLYS